MPSHMLYFRERHDIWRPTEPVTNADDGSAPLPVAWDAVDMADGGKSRSDGVIVRSFARWRAGGPFSCFLGCILQCDGSTVVAHCTVRHRLGQKSKSPFPSGCCTRATSHPLCLIHTHRRSPRRGAHCGPVLSGPPAWPRGLCMRVNEARVLWQLLFSRRQLLRRLQTCCFCCWVTHISDRCEQRSDIAC